MNLSPYRVTDSDGRLTLIQKNAALLAALERSERECDRLRGLNVVLNENVTAVQRRSGEQLARHRAVLLEVAELLDAIVEDGAWSMRVRVAASTVLLAAWGGGR